MGVTEWAQPRCSTGGWRRENLWVTDAKAQVIEARGGGHAAVLGVGLLHWITVLQSVHTHPRLMLASWLSVRPFLHLHTVARTPHCVLVLKGGVVWDIKGIPGLCEGELSTLFSLLIDLEQNSALVQVDKLKIPLTRRVLLMLLQDSESLVRGVVGHRGSTVSSSVMVILHPAALPLSRGETGRGGGPELHGQQEHCEEHDRRMEFRHDAGVRSVRFRYMHLLCPWKYNRAM